MGAWVVAIVVLWLALMVIGWWAERTSPRGDLATGLLALLVRVYCRLFHGLRVEGGQWARLALEARSHGRPVVIVANHAAGIDPFLVQSGFPTFIRWVVGMDTIVASVNGFIRFADPVCMKGGGGSEMAGVREALRHLASGGILGIFPEGRIVREAGAITPFQPGIGLIIGKSKALVLPAVITGVPIRDVAYTSFFVPSRSKVTWHAPIDFAAEGVKSGLIAGVLEAKFAQWLGARVIKPIDARAK